MPIWAHRTTRKQRAEEGVISPHMSWKSRVSNSLYFCCVYVITWPSVLVLMVITVLTVLPVPFFLWPVVFDPPHSTQSVSLAHPAHGGTRLLSTSGWNLSAVLRTARILRSLVWRHLSRTRRVAAGGPTGCCAPGAQLSGCSLGPVGRWSPEGQMSWSVFLFVEKLHALSCL